MAIPEISNEVGINDMGCAATCKETVDRGKWDCINCVTWKGRVQGNIYASEREHGGLDRGTGFSAVIAERRLSHQPKPNNP